MKFLFEIGYKSFVVSAEQAQTIWDLLREAEIYQTQTKGYGSERVTTYHVYDQDELCEPFQMKMLTDRQYQMAKLAGQPQD